MPFTIPSMSEARDYLVALGKALYAGLNFGSRRSYHGKRTTFYAGAMTELHSHTASAQRDLHPLTAGEGKPINDWGSATGVIRKSATPARKSAAGRIRGTATSTVLPDTQLRHLESGLLFQIANTTTVTIPGILGDPDGYVDADIVGVDTGSQTRLEAGQDLVFLSPPPGIEATVKLQLDLDEDGFDDEQFGGYRQRFLQTFSGTPAGGSKEDFARWTREALPAISAGYSFPNRAGRGTIDVAGFHSGSGSSRNLDSTERDAVVEYIKTKAPFQIAGDGGGLRCLETVEDPQRIEILIETTSIKAFAFDWVDSGYFVAAYNSTTRELQFNAALPGSLRAGHGVVFDGVVTGSGVNAQDGTEYKIEAITGADTVILEKNPPVTPLPDDLIFSGGPLVKPVRDAIKAHLDGEIVYAGRGRTPIPASKAASSSNPTGPSVIGLDVLAEGIGPYNPDGIYGDWTDGILLASLFTISTYKAGVRNITIVSPVADYFPPVDAFPVDDVIHFVTPLVVLIRSA